MGDFEAYTVDDLKEIVDHDKPEVMYSQARGWDELGTALDTQADLLTLRLAAGRGGPHARPTPGIDTGPAPERSDWDSKAGRAYFATMEEQCRQLRAAAERARENGEAWSLVADQVHNAKLTVTSIHEEWTRTNAASKDELSKSGDIGKYREDSAREEFDRRAREAMDISTVQIEQTYSTRLLEHDDFTPLPDLGGPDTGLEAEPGGRGRDVVTPRAENTDDDKTGDGKPKDTNPDPKNDEPGFIEGSPPSDYVEPVGPPEYLDSPPSDDGPDLQGPMPTMPGPSPTLPTPTPGPVAVQPMPPVVPIPPPGGIRPPVLPGGIRPPVTLGLRPVPVPRPPGVTAPGTTAKTVPSVIGARPGTTGMAPTSVGRTPAPARPVIGGRSNPNAAKGSKPMGRLIGDRGVVSSGRPGTGKAAKGGKSAERDETVKPGDGEETFWTPPRTVAGVIGGRDLAEANRPVFHDPGPVFGREPLLKEGD